MFLFWGPERIRIYNDAYRASLGETGRHPRALGMRGEDCWTDIWPVIASDLDAALLRAESTWYEDRLIPIERNGHLEPVWWTYFTALSGTTTGTWAGCLSSAKKRRRKLS